MGTSHEPTEIEPTASADIVVGMGPTGESVAGQLAEAGFAVVGTDRDLVGGGCPFWRCVPSKMMTEPPTCWPRRDASPACGQRRGHGRVGAGGHRISAEATDDWTTPSRSNGSRASAATGTLVGATAVGPIGGEVLGLLALAVHAEVPVARLQPMIDSYRRSIAPSKMPSTNSTSAEDGAFPFRSDARDSVTIVLRLDHDAFDDICDLAIREYPLEMCGLIAGGAGTDHAVAFHPCRNIAASAKVYTIDPKDHLRAERDADDHDREIIGVVHSHTHSEPYPSQTDVRQAPDPDWHYVIVSLKRDAPELRSYRIIDGEITEEPVELVTPVTR